MEEFSDRLPDRGDATPPASPSEGTSAIRASLESSLREVTSRFDAARDEGRGGFTDELSQISSRQLDSAKAALSEQCERILENATERLRGQLASLEAGSMQSATAALGEKFSTVIESELKAATERQSAALAAVSLQHRRALEKTIGDHAKATSESVERSLVSSLDLRLAEVQAVVDSQIRQRASGFEASLAGALEQSKQDLAASNDETVARLGAEAAEAAEARLRAGQEQALAAQRDQLALEGQAQVRERSQELEGMLTEQLASTKSQIAEQLAEAERRIGAQSLEALEGSRVKLREDIGQVRDELAAAHQGALASSSAGIAEQAERVGAELAARAEQGRIELGSRIETGIREAREEINRASAEARQALESSNAEAIESAQQRTLVDGGAALTRLAGESASEVEERLGSRFDALRAELVLSAEDSARALVSRIDGEVSSRVAQARSNLDSGAREMVEHRLAELAGMIDQRVDGQVGLRIDALRESLKAETESLLGSGLDQMRQEAEQRSLEGQQRATLSAIEGSRGEVVARIDAELQRLAAANKVELGDHDEKIEAMVEQARTEINGARTQIEQTAEGLERRARRHELRLVQQESTTRVQDALSTVEARAESVERESALAAERLDAAKIELRNTEGRIAEAMNRVDRNSGDLGDKADQALRRLENAMGEIEVARSRILSVEQRVGESEMQVRKMGEITDQATAVELRIRRANEAEADAAAKIVDAERRLADLID